MNLQCKQRGWIWIGQFIQDIRFALRMLRKNPGFTALAVLTLGLGIGAASTMFGVYEKLILNPVNYPNPDQIVYIWSNYNKEGSQPLSAPDFLDIREQSTSFSSVGVYSPERLNLGLDTPVPVYAVRCTAGVLQTLGARPMLGRLLNEADEKSGAGPVAVITYSLWKREFSSDPNIIGRNIRIDGKEFSVVGIMPEDFEFQSPWYDGHDMELYTALTLTADQSERDSHYLLGIGRLKDGITIEAADAEIKAIGARLTKEYPDTNIYKPFQLISLLYQITKRPASGGGLLLAAVMLLLLVACANVAGLLLARGARRQGEFGVRMALGGTRRDIIRLLLLESIILASIGTAVGVILAKWGFLIMRHMIPAALTITAIRESLQLNTTVILFSAGIAAISVFIFGLLPAFLASRTRIVDTIKGSSRSQTSSGIRHRFLQFLVAGQIVMAVVLGNGAILLSASYLKILQDNQDINTDAVVTAALKLSGDRYKEAESIQAFWSDLLDRIKAIPVVESVGITNKLPLGGGNNFSILIDDESFDPAITRPLTEKSFVTSEYFTAMGIPVLRGRPPRSEDAGEKVVGVAINQSLANKYWPGQDPIGRRIRPASAEPWFDAVVVGVVGDVRQWGAERSVIPEIYLPRDNKRSDTAMLVVRASIDAHTLIPVLRHTVASIDKDLPLAEVMTMKDIVSDSTSSRRFLTQLVGFFMFMTIVLAMVGVYGTLSYTLSQRRREIGIRIALGGMRQDILKFVFRQAAPMVVGGLAAGILLSICLSFLMRSALYGIKPLDLTLIFTGLIVVGLSACAACIIPARRASQLDPMEALRCE